MAVIMIVTLTVSLSAYALTTQEKINQKEEEKKQTQENLAQTQENIDGMQQQQNSLKGELNNLNNQLEQAAAALNLPAWDADVT